MTWKGEVQPSKNVKGRVSLETVSRGDLILEFYFSERWLKRICLRDIVFQWWASRATRGIEVRPQEIHPTK